MKSTRTIAIVLLIVTISHMLLSFTSAIPVGVCYGANGDNLPSPSDVINLYKKSQIEKIRLFEPIPEILQALRGSNIKVAIGTKNQDLDSLSTSPDAANAWVQTNIVPYNDVSFAWITAGNEAIPGDYAQYVVGAMTNLDNALAGVGLKGKVKVTTVLSGSSLNNSYPPSQGTFTQPDVMSSVAEYLTANGAPLFANLYPYFSYAHDPNNIPLDYALFTSQEPRVTDGDYKYYNLFDATVDAYNAALEKLNFPNVNLIIGESGWPSAGNDPFTSIKNAQTYNRNLIAHLSSGGTPRKPNEHYDVFLFEMFNEDLKRGGEEQNFGLFFPNMEPVYPLFN